MWICHKVRSINYDSHFYDFLVCFQRRMYRLREGGTQGEITSYFQEQSDNEDIYDDKLEDVDMAKIPREVTN